MSEVEKPFDSNDASYLSLLCTSLKPKLEAIANDCKRKNFITKNHNFSKIIVEILRSKSLSQLLKAIASLAHILEFQLIEVIFHDSKSTPFFKV